MLHVDLATQDIEIYITFRVILVKKIDIKKFVVVSFVKKINTEKYSGFFFFFVNVPGKFFGIKTAKLWLKYFVTTINDPPQFTVTPDKTLPMSAT
jgi:hypothetical protein